MTTQELINNTRRIIQLEDTKYNIISKNQGDIHTWGIEVSIQNIIITIKATHVQNKVESNILLGYTNDNFTTGGEIVKIPMKNEVIKYSVYEELINTINSKVLVTEDKLTQDIKSILRESTITKILD